MQIHPTKCKQAPDQKVNKRTILCVQVQVDFKSLALVGFIVFLVVAILVALLVSPLVAVLVGRADRRCCLNRNVLPNELQKPQNVNRTSESEEELLRPPKGYLPFILNVLNVQFAIKMSITFDSNGLSTFKAMNRLVEQIEFELHNCKVSFSSRT